MDLRKEIRWVIIFGIGIRIFLAAWLYHTDLKNIYIESGFIKAGWKLAYQAAAAAGRPIYYPPLVYSIIEGHRKIDGFMFSGYFGKWLGDGTAEQTTNHPHLFRDLLVMKLPWMAADIFLAFLLYQLAEAKDKRKVLWLWIFNPLTLYGVYGIGNFDILPTVLMVLSLYWAKKNHWNWGYLALGLAGGLKLFGLLLIPIYFILDKRDFKQKLFGASGGVGIFIAATFTAWTDKFVFRSIFLSNLSGTLFKTRLELAAGYYVPIFLTLYLGFLFWLSKGKRIRLEDGYLLVIGLLLGLSYFNPQWIVWLAPLLVLTLLERRSGLIAYLVLVWGYFLSVIVLNDKFVGWGLLKAINNAFDSLNPLAFTVARLGLTETVSGIGRAMFLAAIVSLIHQAFTEGKREEWKEPSFRLTAAVFTGLMILIFIGAHVVLAKNGRYIAINRTNENPKILLTSLITVSQAVETTKKNINSIEIRLKNVNLQTVSTLEVKVGNRDGSEIRKLPIDGGSIGDDYNLLLTFEPIRDPKGEITFSLTMPMATPGKELLIPYDENYDGGGLAINNKPIKGSLAFTIYFNPGGLKNNMAYSLKRMVEKW